MEEALKNRVILILVILTLIFFLGTVSSCASAFRQKVARDKEMTARLDLEEKMAKFTQDKTILDEQSKKTGKDLNEEKAAHETTKKALLQEQLVNQSLKDELMKVSKLKDALEEDLKNALAACKSAKPKR